LRTGAKLPHSPLRFEAPSHQRPSFALDLQTFLAADADAQARLLAVLIDLIAEHGDADGESADDEVENIVSAHVATPDIKRGCPELQARRRRFAPFARA
jgi:hypothetical protein